MQRQMDSKSNTPCQMSESAFKIDLNTGPESSGVHGGHPEAARGCLEAIQNPPESTFKP